jgi:hypothetical protein
VGENGHAYLVTARGIDLPALSIFERLGDGDYRLRARLFPADQDGKEIVDPFKDHVDPFKDQPTQTIFWSDENGDGKPNPGESHALPEVIRFRPVWTGQDLGLQGTTIGPDPQSWRFPVQDWTACGAPRYDSGRVALPKDEGEVSADGRMVLGATTNPEAAPMLVCRELAGGREAWKVPLPVGGQTPIGAALLPAPLGNVWVVASEKSAWHLVTADGFDLGPLLEADAAKVRWPKAAQPGADMTHASLGPGHGSLAHTIDGKLSLQAGDSAYWNMEVTGLEKVRALPGGKINVPAPK